MFSNDFSNDFELVGIVAFVRDIVSDVNSNITSYLGA